MVFSSTVFLFLFLPIVLCGYYLLSSRYRNVFLALTSLFFYAWGENKLVFLMIFSIALNYLGGLAIGYFIQKGKQRFSKYTLWISILINVLLLVYFKYANFMEDSLLEFGILTESSLSEIVLPIGISFFTFQGMSYLIDVYYQKVRPQESLISLSLYISMFPQLIAGPIVRYIDVEKQIRKYRVFNLSQFSEGVRRFIVGLFKKVIIANQMGFVADIVFDGSGQVGALSHWLGIVCYSFQIYFDFSGYSDMAIGLGKMFGFNFLENFNLPYISQSIKEFWRRWHISLSSWFRDYLYIPLGGNRKGTGRTYFNLILVFFVTGLWHGASWSFVIWGLYHGFFLILERLGLETLLNRIPRILRHLYTMLIVLFGWVLFRAETLRAGVEYINSMFSFENRDYEVFQYVTPYFILVFIVAILLSTNIKSVLVQKIKGKRGKRALDFLKYPFYLLIFVICILELAANNYNPFIYFRF